MNWNGIVVLASTLLLFSTLSGTGPGRTSQAEEAKGPGDFETRVFEELNLARTNPDQYAEFARELRERYDGLYIKRPGEATIITNEGPGAVDEAIEFLDQAKPLPPFSASPGMRRAATDHVRDQAGTGETGHAGSDGSQPWERINRYGQWKARVAENISYGAEGPRDVVMNLIVDDGVPDRGHRDNIFNPYLRVIGIACGAHPLYQHMCVMTLAAAYKDGDRENDPKRQR